MSKEDEAERARFQRAVIPARPKGSAPRIVPSAFEFTEPAGAPEENDLPADPADLTAFHSFTLILRTLRKYPKTTQKEMIGLISEMLLE